MIPLSLAIALGIGTVVMFIPIMIQSFWKKIPVWKSVIITLLLAVTGTAGIYIWFFVENLHWGGRSFYGAVFFVPLVSVAVAKMLRMDYGVLTDISAPAGCAMQALMKVKCYLDGCCRGMRLYRDAEGVAHFFPSQIVECVTALAICVVLLLFARQKKKEGTIYPWFLILYGATRFVLNSFRVPKPYLWIIPAGHLWSMVAVAIGIVWLVVKTKKRSDSIVETIK